MSEIKKVTLPKEVAEAIERLRGLGRNNHDIIAASNGVMVGTYSMIIKTFAKKPGNFDILLSALVNGYEVKATKEDHVRDYVNRLKELAQQAHDKADHEQESEFLSEITGAIMVLNQLGIKIEGVNTDEKEANA